MDSQKIVTLEFMQNYSKRTLKNKNVIYSFNRNMTKYTNC